MLVFTNLASSDNIVDKSKHVCCRLALASFALRSDAVHEEFRLLSLSIEKAGGHREGIGYSASASADGFRGVKRRLVL